MQRERWYDFVILHFDQRVSTGHQVIALLARTPHLGNPHVTTFWNSYEHHKGKD